MTDIDFTDKVKVNQVKKDGRIGGNRKKDSTKRFVEKAKKVHGDKFDYSKTIYVGSQHELIITCRAHGDFKQTATRHLRSRHACSYCAKSDYIDDRAAQFLKNAKRKHGDRYDYSKVRYSNATKAVLIICPDHGAFKRTPASHLVGYGCNACVGIEDRIRTTKDFVKRAIEIHAATDLQYDYSETEYVRHSKKVSIRCSKHGVFKQSPFSHLRGAGCPTCANEITGGYSRSDFKRLCDKNNSGYGLLYVIRCRNKAEFFYKVGITSNDLKKRFRSKREMPYNFDTLYLIKGNANYIYDLEVDFQSQLRDAAYKPKIQFRGYTECFDNIDAIAQLLSELSTTPLLMD